MIDTRDVANEVRELVAELHDAQAHLIADNGRPSSRRCFSQGIGTLFEAIDRLTALSRALDDE